MKGPHPTGMIDEETHHRRPQAAPTPRTPENRMAQKEWEREERVGED